MAQLGMIAAACALASFLPPAARADGPRAELFPLRQVRLLDGPFKSAQETDGRYILAHDVDRLLAPFRREAGLPPKAESYGNWESTGLDGHTAGHYLSALAMMSASTGEQTYQQRLSYMVVELAECQRANGNGYVGGIPQGNALWADIAAGKMKVNGFGLNDRWVPWYNLHKLFAGLRDAYLIAGHQQARTVLVGLADWCGDLTAHLSDAQMQQMLAAEHGGMNEVLADVAAITGDAKYLALARRFCHQAILRPLAAGKDELTGKHANTQIPKIIGFQRIAALTGDADLHRAAEYFWQNVTTRRSIALGGNSVNEHFHRTDDFSSMIEDRTGPETCNTYNMLRLSEQLFLADPQARYAEFYERALYNHVLSTQHLQRGGFVYFTPMRPRHYRVYSQPGQAFWCCVGTGFENHARYGQFIYARAGDQSLFVNLFIASELHWPERGLTLRQQTRFPDEPRTQLTLSLAAPTELSLNIRVPQWLRAGQLTLTINGNPHNFTLSPSGYCTITRHWNTGDTIDISLPMHVTTEALPDPSGYVALRYGPIVLAAATGNENLTGLFAGAGRGDHIAPGPLMPLHDAPTLIASRPQQIAELVKPVPSEPLTFSLSNNIQPAHYQNLKLIPFFRLHDSRYSVYFRVATPEQFLAEKQRIETREREQLLLEQATLDRVIPGTQQSESDHAFKGEETSTGTFRDRPWRDARGWFSYELKSPGDQPAELLVTYASQDQNRTFQILVNNRPLARVNLTAQPGIDFYSVRYPLPASPADQPLIIKFIAEPNSVAGGLFDVRIVKTK